MYILISFLAKSERANLYLKLFKLVFGSVSLFAQENEQMLKVRKSNYINLYYFFEFSIHISEFDNYMLHHFDKEMKHVNSNFD